MSNNKSFLLTLCLGIISSLAVAGNKYFICGSDGDSCAPGSARYCACIPYNETEASQAYCLDFDKLTCRPLSQEKDCSRGSIARNQGECLALLYTSTELPPCNLTTEEFCISQGTSICDADGRPESCHPRR